MTTVREEIPEGLKADVDAAVAWFNATQNLPFDVTGIIDPETALAASGVRELRLVLCGGDRCEQRSFRVTRESGTRTVALLEDTGPTDDGQPIAELDPPPGARRAWLGQALTEHAFVVLLFYRGFW